MIIKKAEVTVYRLHNNTPMWQIEATNKYGDKYSYMTVFQAKEDAEKEMQSIMRKKEVRNSEWDSI